MHELAIAQSVVDAVGEHSGGARVARVRLRVGALAGVVPDAIRFCFELVADGTCVEGADLVIEEVAGQGHCRTCDCAVALPDLILLCPCGSADVQILAGRELMVESIDMV
jgi:hydrogenase nickel incorporation protein HypA/HybF